MVTSYVASQLDENFGKVTCERTWKWDTSKRPLKDFDLWYAWSGKGSMKLNDESYSVDKGSCFLFRPEDRTLAGHNPQQPLTVTFLHFSLPVESAPPLPSYTPIKDTFLFETYLNQYVDIMLAKPSDYVTEAKLLLTLMLIHLQREQESNHASSSAADREPLTFVIRTVAYRVRQYPGTAHSLQSLAESAGLSPRYFCIKFKSIMGITVEQFIIQTKMERAEHLLRFNGMNVSKVAEALGYKDLSFFSRQFKQVRGFPPSRLIRKQEI